VADTKAGEVIHFYDKISVAIVKLANSIKVGDTLKFKRGDNQFEQTVDSMEVEHQSVQSAKKGDEVGIKVDQAVKQKTAVFKTP